MRAPRAAARAARRSELGRLQAAWRGSAGAAADKARRWELKERDARAAEYLQLHYRPQIGPLGGSSLRDFGGVLLGGRGQDRWVDHHGQPNKALTERFGRDVLRDLDTLPERKSEDGELVYSVGPAALTEAIEFLGRCGLAAQAAELYKGIPDRLGHPPGLAAGSALLLAYAAANDSHNVQELLRELRASCRAAAAASDAPSGFGMYNPIAVLQNLRAAGLWRGAQLLLEVMQREAPEEVWPAHLAAVAGACRDKAQADELRLWERAVAKCEAEPFREQREAELGAVAAGYLQCCRREKNVEGAWQVMQRLREAGIEPNTNHWTSYFTVMAEAATRGSVSLQLARDGWNDMKQSGVQPNRRTYRAWFKVVELVARKIHLESTSDLDPIFSVTEERLKEVAPPRQDPSTSAAAATPQAEPARAPAAGCPYAADVAGYLMELYKNLVISTNTYTDDKSSDEIRREVVKRLRQKAERLMGRLSMEHWPGKMSAASLAFYTATGRKLSQESQNLIKRA